MPIELGEKIGAGGTGYVHEGPDNTVYKITNGSDMGNIDLLREHGMLSRVEGAGGIPSQKVIDAGRLDGRCYIQMERIDGVPLDELLHEWDPTFEEMNSIRDQIADIFAKLEEAGLFHGDATGIGNYMISETDDGMKVHIIDFVEGGIDETGETARKEAAAIDNILHRVTPNAPKPETDDALAL